MKISKQTLKSEQAVSGVIHGQERSTIVSCEGYEVRLVALAFSKNLILTFGVQFDPFILDCPSPFV